jgi:serine/threonine-protein kinase
VSGYRIKRLLAKGGMAEVFVAERVDDRRDVVVKRLLGPLAGDPMFRELFEDEARLALQLDHDNIVGVLDVGFEHGEYFIAMEYVDGIDVEELVDTALRTRSALLSVGAAVYATRCIVDALAYAHGLKKGIVHRDVNAGNVLLGRDGSVKLCDFGIARCAEHIHKTIPGAVVGKPGFMAPEQEQGQVADARADVYGAATVLLYALTGLVPDGARTRAKLAEVKAPAALIDVVMRALEPDAQKRTATARAFLAELAPFALDDNSAAREIASAVARLRPPPRELTAEAPVTKSVAGDGETEVKSAPSTSMLPTRIVRVGDETVRVDADRIEDRIEDPARTAPNTETMERSNIALAAFTALAFVSTFAVVIALRLLLR